ncbi:MAG: T9SS type A sorting domain-containing protein [Bacteroidaceae bacterium]|nr:T9SS type A sorting domain-containing protein [Bacteroidaceae bacterium]
MKKIYQKITMVALALLMATNMVAQTTAYAITSNTNMSNCSIISFDVSDPSKILETIWEDTIADNGAVMATLADSIYYVYTSKNEFCSINMTSGMKTLLSTASASSAEYWYDICYDSVTEKLYGLRKIDMYETIDGENELVATEYQLCTIDASTGKWTEFAVLPSEIVDQNTASYYLGGICADGKGGIYVLGANKWFKGTGMQSFWNSYINLYCVDLTTKETEILFESDEATVLKVMYSNIVGAGAKVSMEMHDGTIYYMGSSNLLTIDPTTGVTTINANKASKDPVGLCFAKSTADGTPAPTVGDDDVVSNKSVVKVVETYGDHMGERVGQMTHKTISLYDGENRLQREATYGLSYNNEWEIEYFKEYQYNEAGQLVMSASQKYGIHDGTDLAFIGNKDTVKYEYDEAGHVAKETLQAGGYSMVYEYNEAGQLVKEIKQLPDYYDQYEGDFYSMYEITYSAFNEFGKPDSLFCEGLYEKYYGAYTYDEQGRKIAANTWNFADSTALKQETWTYEFETADTAMVYYIHEWYYSFDMGERRTVYTYDNGDINRTKEQVQTYADGRWINEVTFTITEVSEMNPEVVAKLEVSDAQLVSDTLEHNSALLTITLPDGAVTGTLALDVYRHGILLARLNAIDAVEGKLTYIDEGTKNGTVDYYVQTVLINELMETEEALNISNVVTYTHFVELPVVEYLECTSARIDMSTGVYYVTIEWADPLAAQVMPLAEDFVLNDGHLYYGFQRFNVMRKDTKAKAADNGETNGLATVWEMECGYTGVAEVYIQSVFKYGKVNSEVISVNAKEIIKAQGIEAAKAEAQVYVNNGVVTTTAAANMTAYNAQGALVAEVAGATTLNLNTLPTGIYLVKVETAEGVKTVKVRN